jgi:hypothetical protein
MDTAGASIVQLYSRNDQGQGCGTEVERVETDVHLEFGTVGRGILF